ncbi:fused MFS/spermidine synthase [Bosea sp. NPDC055332]
MNPLIISIVFLLSGFSSLIYQVIWQRVLTQIIGVDSLSVAFIVAIFLFGLGLGALASAPLLRGAKARTLALSYAAIELVIGVYGALSVPLLREVNGAATAANINATLSIDFLINLGLLFLPTFLMGATTPIIVQLMKSSLSDLGKTTGRYYGLNILGAAIGALGTGLIFIELLGLIGSTWLAATVNLALAVTVVMFARGDEARGLEEIEERAGVARRWPLIAAGFLFGFATLTMQMLFFRVLANYSTMASITFPIILTAYLVLMAIGQVVGGRTIDRFGVSAKPFVWLFVAGAALLTATFLIPPTAFLGIGGLVVSPSFAVFLDRTGALVGDPNPALSLIFATLFMASLIAFTAFFPMLTKIATEKVGLAGGRFAEILAVTTLGNVFGAFVTGLWLVGALGTINTFVVALVAIAVAILLVAHATGAQLSLRLAGTLAAICIAAALVMPHDYYKRFSFDRFNISEVVEGHNGVVSIVPTSRFFTLAAMFRTESGLAMHRYPEPSDNYQAWRINMAEAMAIDPTFRPKRVLVLGLGHAYGIRAMLDYEFVEKVVVVEISKEILDSARKYSTPDIARIFNDPRVEIVLEDGRRYIQKAYNRGERFDLVEDRINEPWRAGSSNLFSVEFFQAVKAILNPGGYLSIREMTSHIVTALSVFRTGFWAQEHVHAYFTDKDVRTPDPIAVPSEIRQPFLSLVPGQGGAKQEERGSLNYVRLSASQFPDVPRSTDDRPVLEYSWLRQMRGPLTDRVFLASQVSRLPMKRSEVRFEP